MLPISLIQRENPVRLIHHAANCKHSCPPGSPGALEGCLSAGSAIVEIDVVPLADASFALIHDRDLSVETSGSGDAIQATRKQVKKLTYKVDGEITKHKIGFLEEAVEIFAPIRKPSDCSLISSPTPRSLRPSCANLWGSFPRCWIAFR